MIERMRPTGFMGVRADELGQYLDTSSFNILADECRKSCDQMDARMPGWAQANKLKRIVQVRVEVME